MTSLLPVVPVLVAAALLALLAWRQIDHRNDRAEMVRLRATQPMSPPTFDPALVAGLPEPARRFFEHAIRPGTPLYNVAEIEMTGQFGMGTKDAPNYMDMRARQVLAAPEGFIWKADARRGAIWMSGSDSATWTRFWLAGLLPVARLGGTEDHRRSAFGRCIAEAVIWTPAAVLPGPGVVWQGVDADIARVVVSHEGLDQSVDVTLDSEGRAVRVQFPRWSDANSARSYRIQPFGSFLSEHREFQGFSVPTHIEAGNFFGTENYFPFFIADISDMRFPALA